MFKAHIQEKAFAAKTRRTTTTTTTYHNNTNEEAVENVNSAASDESANKQTNNEFIATADEHIRRFDIGTGETGKRLSW